MIALIIKTCDVLNVDLNLQYNESPDPNKAHEDVQDSPNETKTEKEGVSTISISGMTCSACTTTVESALRELKGVESALVSLHFQEARVFHAPDIDRTKLVSAITHVGYDASLGERAAPQKIDTIRQQAELLDLRKNLARLSTLSTIILILGDGVDYLGLDDVFHGHKLNAGFRQASLSALAGVAAFKYSNRIFRSAFEQAKRLRVNMHSLVAASSILGMGLSLFNVLSRADSNNPTTYYNTVIGVLFIVSAGRYVDLLSRRQATNTFVGLYSLLEETSRAKLVHGEVKEG